MHLNVITDNIFFNIGLEYIFVETYYWALFKFDICV